MSSQLFTPLRIGHITLGHRIIMAPLTRFRANARAAHEAIAEEYYDQRASEGGLIITEATYIGEAAGGQPNAPGLWTDEQVAAWKRIVDKVHAKGGYIYAQLRADGRAAVPDYIRSLGHKYVAPSAVPLDDASEVPEPLDKATIERFIKMYGDAAKNAVERAGFDGVEIHNANGYLPDQFLDARANLRTDEYGGSVENRARFTLAALKAVVDAVGEHRAAIRFSPYNTFQTMAKPHAEAHETFSYVTRTIRDRYPALSYIHFVEPRITGDSDKDGKILESLQFVRDIWSEKGDRPFLAAGGFTRESAEETVGKLGGGIVFGRFFVANPDLPLRFQKNLSLNPYDRSTFYSPTGPSATKGYTDYPRANDLSA